MHPEPFDYFIQPSMYNERELAQELWWFLKSLDEDSAEAVELEFPEIFRCEEDFADEDYEMIGWAIDAIETAINNVDAVLDSKYAFGSEDDLYCFMEVEE